MLRLADAAYGGLSTHPSQTIGQRGSRRAAVIPRLGCGTGQARVRALGAIAVVKIEVSAAACCTIGWIDAACATRPIRVESSVNDEPGYVLPG